MNYYYEAFMYAAKVCSRELNIPFVVISKIDLFLDGQ